MNDTQAGTTASDASSASSAKKTETHVMPRRVELPPDPNDRLRVWLLLGLCLALCLPVLLAFLTAPDATRHLETRLMATSQETWLRQHLGRDYLTTGSLPAVGQSKEADTPDDGEPGDEPDPATDAGASESASPADAPPPPVSPGDADAWLMPSYNGVVRVDDPPMAVWLNMLSWSGLDPMAATPDQLLARSRILAAVLALLTLAATFWAAFSVGRLQTATLATLILGTSYLFIREMRIADTNTHLLAWVTLAIGAAFWAMRPLKPVNWTSRKLIGWTVCAAAMAAALLTKGPVALLFVGVPVVACIVAQPHRRAGNALGLLCALIFAAIAWLSWYLWIAGAMPEITEHLKSELTATDEEARPFWYYLTIFGYVMPWSLWLISGLFQPWLAARGVRRQALLIGWLWFVALLVVLSLPAAKHLRLMIPLLPAAAIVCAQVWTAHAEMAAESIRDPWVNWVRIPHWAALILASIALPVFVVYQAELVKSGYIETAQIESLGWPVMGPLAGGLLAIAALGAYWHWRWRPTHAAGATVAWMLIVATTGFSLYGLSDQRINPYRTEARSLAEVVDGAELVYLFDGPTETAPEAGSADRVRAAAPSAALLFYSQRIVRPVTPTQLDTLAASDRPVYVLVRPSIADATTGRMVELGFHVVGRFHDGRRTAEADPGSGADAMTLYRAPGLGQPTADTPAPVSSWLRLTRGGTDS